jgi:hypothetical protein
MHQAFGAVIAVVSGSGFPITQFALARFGRPGALVVGAMTTVILARDVSLIVTSRDTGDTTGPAVILYAETAVAVLATVANLSLATERGLEASRARGWRVGWVELVRRASLGLLFGMHAMRFRSYLDAQVAAGDDPAT